METADPVIVASIFVPTRMGSIGHKKKTGKIVGAKKKVSYKADKSFGVFRGDTCHDRSLQISDWKTICEEIQVALKGAKMEEVKYHWTMVGGRVSQRILGNVSKYIASHVLVTSWDTKKNRGYSSNNEFSSWRCFWYPKSPLTLQTFRLMILRQEATSQFL